MARQSPALAETSSDPAGLQQVGELPPVVGRGGVVGEVEVGAVLVRGGEDAAEDGLGAGLALLGRDAEVAEAVLALSGELLMRRRKAV